MWNMSSASKTWLDGAVRACINQNFTTFACLLYKMYNYFTLQNYYYNVILHLRFKLSYCCIAVLLIQIVL